MSSKLNDGSFEIQCGYAKPENNLARKANGKKKGITYAWIDFSTHFPEGTVVDLICGTQVLHTNGDPYICAEIIALTSPLDETLGR